MTDFDQQPKAENGSPDKPEPANAPDDDADKRAPADDDDLVLEEEPDGDGQVDGGVNKPSSPRQDVGH